MHLNVVEGSEIHTGVGKSSNIEAQNGLDFLFSKHVLNCLENLPPMPNAKSIQELETSIRKAIK